ncbi:MAG: NERD domain-containing protein, partial [Clostridia bacterium]|nr:NERD domain-containing protein [Clostridia bacterium]
MISVVFIGIVILVGLIYIFLSSVTSDSSKKRQMEKKIRLEQEKERKRETMLAEKIEKNADNLKEVAKIVVKNKEKLLTDYLTKLDFRKLNYDYYSKDLTIEEQKTFYEEKIDKLRDLYKETSQYTSILPFMVQRIYNWYRFTYHYSEPLFDAVKEFGFDLLINVKTLYNEAVKFENEVAKTMKDAEKDYKKICATTETRKAIIKELKRLSKEVVILNNIEIEIEEEIEVMDHIVCTTNGVFCLHTKYLSDDSIENLYISEDNQWTGETFTGQRYYVEPLKGQVLKKIQLFQKWLNSELKTTLGESVPYFMVYPVVIVSNEYV